jgi:hypothetical protein
MENKANFLEYNSLKQTLLTFLEDNQEFKNGYQTLIKLETHKNFHLSLVRLTFEPSISENARKLASCCAKLFVKKNWNENFFEIEEKSVSYISYLEHYPSLVSIPHNRRILL